MIIQKSKVKLNQPVFVYSWPCAGMVGRYVVDYLISELAVSTYAEVDLQKYIPVRNVVVENGIIYSPVYVKEKIYYVRSKNTDVLLFFSDFVPAVNSMSQLAFDLLTFLQQVGVEYVLTFNGIPANILHTDVPKVYIASTYGAKHLRSILKQEIEKLRSGVIEGMNGIILSTAKEFAVEGICLTVEVPFYTIDMYNPQCAKVILDIIEQMFNFELDYNKILQDIKLLDENLRTMFTDINEKAQRLFTQMDKANMQKNKKRKEIVDNSSTTGLTFDELKKQLKFSLPMSAKNKINELFKLASENIEYAKQLKEELDRWGVYKEYEDRFLSLFLKNKPSQERKDNKE